MVLCYRRSEKTHRCLVGHVVPRLVFETPIACTPEELWAFHGSVEALATLTPPDARVEIIGKETAVRNGAIHEIKVVKFGLPVVWKAEISEVQAPRQFRDTALKSPFARWTHLHEFLPHPQGALLRDTVDYQMPLGPLGSLVDALIIRRDVEAMFAHRHRVTQKALTSG
jgi:ligand-binding SRPBCC domain-containing protein